MSPQNCKIKLSPGDCIQLLIAILIGISIIYTGISIRYQNEFNEKTLKPWVYPEVKGNITVDNYRLNHSISLINTGYTPAINVYAYSLINVSKEYPTDTIRQKIHGIDDFKKAIIFPQQKPIAYSNFSKFSLLGSYSDFSFNEFIAKDESQFYLHLYLIYQSPDSDFYYLKETYRMKYLHDTDDGIFVDWTYVWSSLDKL